MKQPVFQWKVSGRFFFPWLRWIGTRGPENPTCLSDVYPPLAVAVPGRALFFKVVFRQK